MVMQIVEWLNKQENQKDFKAMDINVDDKTPLKRFEQPEDSQEIEQEPWGTPKRGYKWYDASTYASGSYGAKGTKQNKTEHSTEEDNNTTNNDTSTFDIPSSISRQEKFNITVHVDESKLINQKFQLSIKNKDGREVGMFNGQAQVYQNQLIQKLKMEKQIGTLKLKSQMKRMKK